MLLYNIFDGKGVKSFFFTKIFFKEKPESSIAGDLLSVVLFAERISAKRHSLIYRTEVIFTIYGARLAMPNSKLSA